MDFWIFWDMIPRPVRRWVLLIFGIVCLVTLPIIGYIAGVDCEQWNIEGLSRTASISEEMAREQTWDWSTIWTLSGLVVGGGIFLFGVLYFAAPVKKEKLWR